VFDVVEVRVLCRPVKFFHTDLDKTFLYGPCFVHGGIVMLKLERAFPSTGSSRMPLYAVALRFPFTGTNEPSPKHENQPQTIIILYAFEPIAFSWHPPNPDSSIGLSDGEA
jgi:hypothetical protein